MRIALSRVSLSAQILLVVALFIVALVGTINAVVQRAVLEGATAITIEMNESAIRAIAGEIGAEGLVGDPRALEERLAAFHDENKNLETIFVSDGERVVASSVPGKGGTSIGSGSGEKGAEIRAVIASGLPESEVERRTDILPRLTYIYPILRADAPACALVSKFSLEEEFGAIRHLREALGRILLIAGIVGAPSLFGLLWLMAIRPLRRLRAAARRLSEGDFDLVLPRASSSELDGLSGTFLEASSILKAQYERYLSPQVVEVLRKERGFRRDIRMRTTASVLMCDIEGFTSLSEGLDVEDLGRFLDGYFRAMTEIIFARRGTVDKYMGDGILAVFGAPLPSPDFRRDAVEAAFEMTRAFAGGYPGWLPASRGPAPASRIRVGIASGELFYGNVGYEKRSDFTVLGTAVNLASRLQELNKETGTAILIDARTAAGLAPGEARLGPAGSVKVRGLSEPVEVWGA